VYKNDKLYCNQPAVGIFHRIISGSDGSNFATRNTETGEYKVIRDGTLDQPDFSYKYKDLNLKRILES
jgi:hypothetical protein